MESYQSLLSGSEMHFLNEKNYIKREDYDRKFCLFVFDLTSDLSANTCNLWNLLKNISFRREARFGKPLTTTHDCIVYPEYYNVLEISFNRQVMSDYTG